MHPADLGRLPNTKVVCRVEPREARKEAQSGTQSRKTKRSRGKEAPGEGEE